MKAWFAVLLLTAIFGCDSKTTVKKPEVHLSPKHIPSDIQFGFQIAKGAFPKKGLMAFDIPFLLVNTSLDTLYLASTSCYGPGSFLEVDSSQLQIVSLKSCQGNSPAVKSILPKDTLHFICGFYNKNATDSIKIGFRLVDAHQKNWQNPRSSNIEANSTVIWKTKKI